MAYMSQEKKAALAPRIKAILAEYGLKGTLRVDHHSTLELNIRSGVVDFIGSRVCRHWETLDPKEMYLRVNNHWCHEQFTGAAKDCLVKLRNAMNDGNHDNSDISTDYFDVGWYVRINVGQWDKPYVLTT